MLKLSIISCHPYGFVAMVKDANTWRTTTQKMAEVLVKTSDSGGNNFLDLVLRKGQSNNHLLQQKIYDD